MRVHRTRGRPAPAHVAAMAAACVIALSPAASAVGSVSTVSPRPMAMGGAFMAVDDDVAAMAWNPAGYMPPLCSSGARVRAHVNILGAPAIARETGLLTGVESEPFSSLPAIEKLSIAVGGVVKSIGFRAGNVAVGALMLEEHLDPAAMAQSAGLADASDLLGAYYTTFTVSFRLAPTVTIGASEFIFAGWMEGPGDRRTGSGRAYGAMLRPNEQVTVGLTYMDLPDEFDSYRLAIEGLGARTMNAGLAWRPRPELLVTLDLRDLSEKHPETSLEPRAGAELSLWGKGAVRAGAYREDAGSTDVLTLGAGVIPAPACRRGGLETGPDRYVLNYAVLLSEGGAPRHLLSAILHF